MQTKASVLLLALIISSGDVLATPIPSSRLDGEEGVDRGQPFRQDIAPLEVNENNLRLRGGQTLSRRASDARLESTLLPFVKVSARDANAMGRQVRWDNSRRRVAGRRKQTPSITRRDSYLTVRDDDSVSGDDALLLGREPRHFAKHLLYALGVGAFGGLMSQAAQRITIGATGLPQEQRSLNDDNDDENSAGEYTKRAGVLDVFAKKLVEKVITAGGSGSLYQVMRHRFKVWLGKAH